MTVLLLAGTSEARDIASALAERGVEAEASLSGEGRLAGPLALPTREGGFGGDAGFHAYLEAHRIRAVVDATHPFAARISWRSARICFNLGMPYLYVARPPWQAEAGDRWTFIDREQEAAWHVTPGATVFLTTGRQGLAGFSNLRGCRLICRRIGTQEGPFPLPSGRFLAGTPPFSVVQERALFEEFGVDWLIVKNSGGEAPRSKLVAARQLGLPVILLNRPAPPEAPSVETVEAALDWVAKLP
jgi:precorrin-6A/cobalt-precorrin-6A reductase